MGFQFLVTNNEGRLCTWRRQAQWTKQWKRRLLYLCAHNELRKVRQCIFGHHHHSFGFDSQPVPFWSFDCSALRDRLVFTRRGLEMGESYGEDEWEQLCASECYESGDGNWWWFGYVFSEDVFSFVYRDDDDNYSEVHNDICNNNGTSKRLLAIRWLLCDGSLLIPHWSLKGSMQCPFLFICVLKDGHIAATTMDENNHGKVARKKHRLLPTGLLFIPFLFACW